MKIEEGIELRRLTTIGTGGPARAFARPETVEELQELLRWAVDHELPVAPVGLGSNLLAADEGFEGLVLKLAGDLAKVERADSRRLFAGGGAPLAVCLHRARQAELGGLEFACAIPGTAGGGVWMNAGAYGGEIAGVMARALVVDAQSARWLVPSQLGMDYRRSNLRPGQIVATVEFHLTPRPLGVMRRRSKRRLGAGCGRTTTPASISSPGRAPSSPSIASTYAELRPRSQARYGQRSRPSQGRAWSRWTEPASSGGWPRYRWWPRRATTVIFRTRSASSSPPSGQSQSSAGEPIRGSSPRARA